MLLGIRQGRELLTTGLSPSMVQDSAASFNTLLISQIVLLFTAVCLPTTPFQ